MKSSLAMFASLALVPAMTGPLPATGGAREMTLPLCGGGDSVTIPLDTPQPPDSSQTPCCAKGCHTGQKRKRIDRAQ